MLKSFRKAARELNIDFSLFGTDITELSPAFQLCDRRFLVKPVKHSAYIKQLLSIVKANKVNLVIPTVDLDLKTLAANKSKFAALGCVILVSSPDVIDICQDKRRTYRFLTSNGFDTPVTMSVRTALSKRKLNWPCFLKPWDGSASKGIALAKNRKELLFFAKKIPNLVVQELIKGTEYTCDAYVDFSMKVRCVVPRKRIEVRAGEVSKAQTIKDARIINEVAILVERLGAGPGVITLQLFLTDDSGAKFVEINPRFGGGAPLAIKAGANFPKWILQELLGQKPRIKLDGFKAGLTMLRYDAEVWFQQDSN